MDSRRLGQLLTPWLASGPAYAAVAAGVRGLALDGRLPIGSRVPSERDLATVLALSRTTVSAAYDVLREQGYLLSAHGAGSRIVLPSPRPTRPDAQSGERPDIIDLTIAAPPAPAAMMEAVADAAAALPRHLAAHGLHPLGLPELREALADRFTARGVETSPDQVLVTGGALAAWDLVLRAMSAPGDRVMVEQPSYPGMLDAVVAHRRRPLALPVTAAGWDLPGPGTARGPAPVLALVTPDAQNPTGLLADHDQRADLLDAMGSATVVSDETFADLVLEGDTPSPLAALGAGVVTLGSMSKSFWAGLRVGWVRASPEQCRAVVTARGSVDHASPVLEQLVALALLRREGEVLSERRAGLRRTRDALVAALASTLPTWRLAPPRAGMVLWVALPDLSATAVAAHALDLGLRVTPGPRFTLDGSADGWLRLPFAGPADQVDAVVAALAQAAQRTRAAVAPRHHPSPWTA